MDTSEFTEHDIKLLRRGLKCLHYELTKKVRKSTFVPKEGSKDITKTNLALTEELFLKVDDWLKEVQRTARGPQRLKEVQRTARGPQQ